MSFLEFKERVEKALKSSGALLYADFKHEDGKHIARVSNGMKIIGNNISKKVMFCWGSGHRAVAAI